MHRFTKIRNSTLFVIPLILILVHTDPTQDPERKIRFFEETNLMRNEVIAQIPLGSSIDESKLVMEQNGFECVASTIHLRSRDIKLKDTIQASRRNGEKPISDSSLECETHISENFHAKQWRVFLTYKNSKLREVSVGYRNVFL